MTDIPDSEVPLEERPTEEEILEEGVPLEGMPPQTGDSGAVVLWLALAVLSGGGIVLLMVTNRKENT